MDEAINLQIGQLFVGQTLPKTDNEMLQRCMIASSYPITTFASNPKNRTLKPQKLAPKPLLVTSISLPLSRYFDGDESASQILLHLDFERMKSSPYSGKAPKKFNSQYEVLAKVRDWLPGVMARMQTPWIKLLEWCYVVVSGLRRKLNEEECYDISNLPEEDDDFTIRGKLHIWVVLCVLYDALYWAIGGGHKNKSFEVDTSTLKVTDALPVYVLMLIGVFRLLPNFWMVF